MADFRVICRALRKTFVENFGEEDGNKIFNALLIEDSEESSSNVAKVVFESIDEEPDKEKAVEEEKSDEKEPTTGNPLLDAILTAVFGGGAK